MNTLEARRRLLGRNVYKRTTEGNPAIAQGSLARRYLGITMQGWTEQDSTTGAQLLPSVIDGLLTDNSGSVSANNLFKTIWIELDIGTYSFSSSEKLYIVRKCINGSNLQNITDALPIGSPYVVEVTQKSYLGLSFRKFDSTEFTGNEEFMLNSGSTAMPYEPYTGGQPSPSPDYPQEIVSAVKLNEETQKYEYEVKLTGANLWDATKAADTSNWVASTTQKGYFDFAIDVVPGQKITFSFPEKLPLGIQMYVGIVSIEDGNIVEWLYHPAAESLIVQQATITAITDKIWVRCNFGGIKIFVQDNPYFQIEYGSKRTDFQPYKEQTLTLTSDRPLTKWDKLEKRNGKWGWGYKSAEIESYMDESVPGEYFSTTGQLSIGAQVWYETTTETFVPLSESEQEQMNALHTFRPTTVLSNDCGCNMTLTYKTKKSLEVTD